MFDFLKSLPGMKLGDVTGGTFAPKPDAGGWATTMQREGSPFVTGTDGSFAGFNPTVGQVGLAMTGAAGQMPGGGAFAPPQPQDAAPAPSYAPRAPMASATPTPTAQTQPSWIDRLIR